MKTIGLLSVLAVLVCGCGADGEDTEMLPTRCGQVVVTPTAGEGPGHIETACAYCGEDLGPGKFMVVCKTDAECPEGWDCWYGCCAESYGCNGLADCQ